MCIRDSYHMERYRLQRGEEDFTRFLQNILRGIDFAVDEINKAGGVNGQMLEVVRGDHAGDAATGKSEAERLITQEGVNVIMGCHMSVVTEVVAQVCQQYGIPMITAISTLDRLTDELPQLSGIVKPLLWRLKQE